MCVCSTFMLIHVWNACLTLVVPGIYPAHPNNEQTIREQHRAAWFHPSHAMPCHAVYVASGWALFHFCLLLGFLSWLHDTVYCERIQSLVLLFELWVSFSISNKPFTFVMLFFLSLRVFFVVALFVLVALWTDVYYVLHSEQNTDAQTQLTHSNYISTVHICWCSWFESVFFGEAVVML